MSKAPPLRMRSLDIEGLFGLYHHHIELKLEDRVTILHGPNGVGKTVLLELVSNFFYGRLEKVARVRFDRLNIEFTDGTRVQIESSGPGRGRRNLRDVTVLATLPDEESKSCTFEEGDGETPRWLGRLRHRMRIHLIETQRLFRKIVDESGDSWQAPTVREDAKHLAALISEDMADYASQSQGLDQSFPQRLIKMAGRALTLYELKQRMGVLEAKRTKLQRIGLLDESTTPPFDIASLDQLDPAQYGVMTLYVEDTEEKLQTLDDLARRIELFVDIINSKFRHKTLRIEPRKGFVAIGYDGASVNIGELSSGEQHELVLLFDLLFRVQSNTLVLIDEPELSFHLLWQKRFLSDLLEIVKAADFDAVVATHSPFIVGDRDDLMVPLDAEAP